MGLKEKGEDEVARVSAVWWKVGVKDEDEGKGQGQGGSGVSGVGGGRGSAQRGR